MNKLIHRCRERNIANPPAHITIRDSVNLLVLKITISENPVPGKLIVLNDDEIAANKYCAHRINMEIIEKDIIS